MGYVNDAFAKMKSNLEITATEESLASRRHIAIRDHIKTSWSVSADFLTGSYRRDTKTKKLKDVDIFIVIDADGPQGGYADKPPTELLGALHALIEQRWPSAYIDGMAIVVPFGKEEDITSMEVVPVFARDGGGYSMPNPKQESWLATDPNAHRALTTEKNTACGGQYVPFVKMVKGANRELGEPVSPSFLLEVMALQFLCAPFGTYQDELVTFFATAADRIHEPFDDPAGLGGNVNILMGATELNAAEQALRWAQHIAETAVDLEDEGQERAAVEKWRELFGNRMPRP